MINRVRGEVALQAGDQTFRLCLTLGALAEIETALSLENLSGLGERLDQPRAQDVLAILGALLRGGGHAVSDADVAILPLELPEVSAKIAAAFEAAGLAPKRTDIG